MFWQMLTALQTHILPTQADPPPTTLLRPDKAGYKCVQEMLTVNPPSVLLHPPAPFNPASKVRALHASGRLIGCGRYCLVLGVTNRHGQDAGGACKVGVCC
jgi:hypothetical protein